ncbi:hypothetical protein EGR_07499 [Echinococcus granulosus]|uniref:Uncharacterized protein n=1 Tax=Echinococcus granulosus TaxID=6210 RepID=W6U8M0_ECHGR|nr:hypothetical protein EGR_07499 [Echinococcus granulosus]EUB57623.1 hypothetical protein EGR_07499 [Echinococcus granulosus]
MHPKEESEEPQHGAREVTALRCEDGATEKNNITERLTDVNSGQKVELQPAAKPAHDDKQGGGTCHCRPARHRHPKGGMFTCCYLTDWSAADAAAAAAAAPVAVAPPAVLGEYKSSCGPASVIVGTSYYSTPYSSNSKRRPHFHSMYTAKSNGEEARVNHFLFTLANDEALPQS